jgi:hypothetical protein
MAVVPAGPFDLRLDRSATPATCLLATSAGVSLGS